VIGWVGALVTLAAVLAIVLVLAVRPPARRFARAAAALRGDVDVRVGRLRDLRRDRPRRGTPSGAAGPPSSIGGRGRHRRSDAAP
jgi:hypothetical protein